MAAFLRFMKSKGVTVMDLHAGGHAGPEAILTLIDTVKPQYILPVHTENAAWFAQHTGRAVLQERSFTV